MICFSSKKAQNDESPCKSAFAAFKVRVKLHQGFVNLVAPLRLRVQSQSRTRLRIAASIVFCFVLVLKVS